MRPRTRLGKAKAFTLLLVLFFSTFFLYVSKVSAAAGINKVINFQGKVVNANGTNVTDGTLDFVFKLYNSLNQTAAATFTESWLGASLFGQTISAAPTVGADSQTVSYAADTNEATLKAGQILTDTTVGNSVVIISVNTTGVGGTITTSLPAAAWSSADAITNKIYVKNGVFRVGINSLNVDAAFGTVDFNTDNIYLGVAVGADSEMKPRIQYTATPYAFNADKVHGLTVTDTTGTFTLTNAKTFSVTAGLTLGGTDSTSFTFPSTTGGTVITSNVASQTITSGATTGTAFAISATGLTQGKGLAITGGTATTTGSDLDINGATYIHTTLNEIGNLANFTFTDQSTNANNGGVTNGVNVASTVNTSGAGTKAVTAFNASAPTFTGCATGACTWDGFKVTTTAPTSQITVNGMEVLGATAPTSSTINGINIGAITGGAGAETGIKIGTGWDNGLDVASNVNISSTMTATGTTTIGSAGNTFTFNPASGPVYAGTARPSKIIVLSPEYAGATLTADGSSTTTGSMTSDNLLNAASGGWKNYYQWTSTSASLQDYTVLVMVTLPQDFDAWQTGTCPGSTCALEIAYKTGVTGTTNNAVSIQVNNAATTPGTVVCTIAASSSTTWSSVGCTSTTLATSPTWNTAGAQAAIRIKLAANSTASALAQVGDITLRYSAKF